MSGNIFLLEQTAVTLTSTGASATDKSAVSAGTFNQQSGGTANLIENLQAIAELTCRFTTITGIVAGTIIADFYVVPAIDGSNYADVDLSAGASYIASNFRVGSFVAHKQLVTATDYRFALAPFDLFPVACTGYVLFRAGQTVTANWTLKLMAARAQYS